MSRVSEWESASDQVIKWASEQVCQVPSFCLTFRHFFLYFRCRPNYPLLIASGKPSLLAPYNSATVSSRHRRTCSINSPHTMYHFMTTWHISFFSASDCPPNILLKDVFHIITSSSSSSSGGGETFAVVLQIENMSVHTAQEAEFLPLLASPLSHGDSVTEKCVTVTDGSTNTRRDVD